jgi:hypothetical protein
MVGGLSESGDDPEAPKSTYGRGVRDQEAERDLEHSERHQKNRDCHAN